MPTYIHLVRHAQGYHNLSLANHALPDPDLTPKGKEQCAALRDKFPFHSKITHLVASPMRRTLFTCLLSFSPSVYDAATNPEGHKVIALPDLQEVSNLPCDCGSPLSKLREEFEAEGSEWSGKVDLGRVPEGWEDKGFGSPSFPEMRKLEARARRARRALREMAVEYRREKGLEGDEGEIHLAVVTHGGFLHFLTQDWDGMRHNVGTGWQNTEYRSYEFVDPTGQAGDEDASLRETRISWRARRGSATGLTDTEQMELRCVVENKLEAEFGGGKVPEIPKE